jgi:hypothetical protein
MFLVLPSVPLLPVSVRIDRSTQDTPVVLPFSWMCRLWTYLRIGFGSWLGWCTSWGWASCCNMQTPFEFLWIYLLDSVCLCKIISSAYRIFCKLDAVYRFALSGRGWSRFYVMKKCRHDHYEQARIEGTPLPNAWLLSFFCGGALLCLHLELGAVVYIGDQCKNVCWYVQST